MGRTDGQTDGQTDGRDGQGYNLMPFRYSSNRRGHKNARVVFLVHDTSSQCDACTGKVS